MAERERIKKVGWLGKAIMRIVVFVVMCGFVAGCNFPKSSAMIEPTSKLESFSDEVVIQTLIAEIQLSSTPTATTTSTPEPTLTPVAAIPVIPTLPPENTAVVSAQNPQTHIVGNDDSCWRIAVDLYQVPMDAFLSINGFTMDNCVVSPGQEVLIPPADYQIPTPTLTPFAAAVSATVGAQAAVAPTENVCHPNYIGACVPIAINVSCTGLQVKSFRHNGYDPYNLDRDKDGICCEES